MSYRKQFYHSWPQRVIAMPAQIILHTRKQKRKHESPVINKHQLSMKNIFSYSLKEFTLKKAH